MTQLTPLIPRKIPRQLRAKVTVEAILDATAHILTKEGYDAATTNRIAEVAGVSIGSLYQYFPNRDVLFAALKARHTKEIYAILWDHAQCVPPGVSLRASLAALIDAFLATHEVNAPLHHIFETALSHIDSSEIDGELDDAFFRKTFALLHRHRNEIKRRDLELATKMAMVDTESVIHDVVLQKTDGAERNLAKAELITLLAAYLGAKSEA